MIKHFAHKPGDTCLQSQNLRSLGRRIVKDWGQPRLHRQNLKQNKSRNLQCSPWVCDPSTEMWHSCQSIRQCHWRCPRYTGLSKKVSGTPVLHNLPPPLPALSLAANQRCWLNTRSVIDTHLWKTRCGWLFFFLKNFLWPQRIWLWVLFWGIISLQAVLQCPDLSILPSHLLREREEQSPKGLHNAFSCLPSPSFPGSCS